jgi:homoserine kinase type II
MAVYTEVSDTEIAAFAEQFAIGRVLSFKGIAEGVENTNYLLLTETTPYILTLYEKRVARSDLPFFLSLIEHLAARGVPCPTPIHGRDGKVLHELCDRSAAITTFLPGAWPRRIGPEHCRELGSALARLHQAGQDFPGRRENALSVAGWRPLFDACAPRADEVADGLAGELDAELAQLERDWPSALPAGVIHADLFPDNVFFESNRLSGLIDFYFACNDFFAYDLAICLNAWCFETDASFNITKARALLSAYRKERALGAEELAALPLLARGAAVRFLLTRLYDWLNRVEGAMVKPHDPMVYVKILRFHRGITGPGAYGLDEAA